MVPIYSLGKIYLMRPVVILVYIFFVHSSVIYGLVNYIFLTLYLGVSGWVTLGTPLRDYFVIKIPLGFLMHFPEKQVLRCNGDIGTSEGISS